MRLLLLSIFLLTTQSLIGQNYDWWINGQTFSGFILAHSDKVTHLIKGRPDGFELNFQKELNGYKYWEQLYNSPIVNYGLSYYDLKNDAQLGKLYIASAAIDLPLARRKYTKLLFRIGTGIVYSTNPYNRETNNQNTMISTRFTCLIQTRFTYEILLNHQFKLTPSINITHASNGAQAVPNRGINIVTANIGCSYKIASKAISIDSAKAMAPTKYRYKYYFLVSTGKNTSSFQVRNPQPFFNLTLMSQKFLTEKSDLQFGIEYFHTLAVREGIRSSWFNKDLTEYPDFKRIGAFIGHELKAGQLGFIAQMGVYIYNPSKSGQAVYQRYGLKYEFAKHLVGQIALKVHSATAEEIEFTFGYKL